MSAHVTNVRSFPLRRFIVIGFAVAALVGGASRYNATVTTQSAAIEATAPVDTIALPTALPAVGPVCDGSVINTACATVEGVEPGPVVALGYGSKAQAKFHCPFGTVIALYRQRQIVGYGCLGGGQ